MSFLARLSALYFLLVFLSLMIGSQLNKSEKLLYRGADVAWNTIPD